jgi:MarR family transcriptional regulator, negative regulator of the multidrug operon emrRAB
MSSKILKTEGINNTEEIQGEVLNRQISRIIVFCDVIDRYLRLRLKNNYSWLRVNTILFLRARGGHLTPSQLAKLMLRSRNSITKLINGLERDGLIKRVHADNDRRTVIIEVTSKGLKFA